MLEPAEDVEEAKVERVAPRRRGAAGEARSDAADTRAVGRASVIVRFMRATDAISRTCQALLCCGRQASMQIHVWWVVSRFTRRGDCDGVTL